MYFPRSNRDNIRSPLIRLLEFAIINQDKRQATFPSQILYFRYYEYFSFHNFADLAWRKKQ